MFVFMYVCMYVCMQEDFTVLEYAKRYRLSKVVRLLEKWLHKVFYELCSLFAYSY